MKFGKNLNLSYFIFIFQISYICIIYIYNRYSIKLTWTYWITLKVSCRRAFIDKTDPIAQWLNYWKPFVATHGRRKLPGAHIRNTMSPQFSEGFSVIYRIHCFRLTFTIDFVLPQVRTTYCPWLFVFELALLTGRFDNETALNRETRIRWNYII